MAGCALVLALLALVTALFAALVLRRDSGWLLTCPDCDAELMSRDNGQLLHHVDGSHTFVARRER